MTKIVMVVLEIRVARDVPVGKVREHILNEINASCGNYSPEDWQTHINATLAPNRWLKVPEVRE
jgi:hypothetical protein